MHCVWQIVRPDHSFDDTFFLSSLAGWNFWFSLQSYNKQRRIVELRQTNQQRKRQNLWAIQRFSSGSFHEENLGTYRGIETNRFEKLGFFEYSRL